MYILYLFYFLSSYSPNFPPPSFVPPPLLDYSLVDNSVVGKDEMLMKGDVVTEAEMAFPMDLLVGVALKQELGGGDGNSAYTQQSNRDHRGEGVGCDNDNEDNNDGVVSGGGNNDNDSGRCGGWGGHHQMRKKR